MIAKQQPKTPKQPSEAEILLTELRRQGPKLARNTERLERLTESLSPKPANPSQR